MNAGVATPAEQVRRYVDVLEMRIASRGNAQPLLGRMGGMSHDWMLVETLGSEPAVVAEGAHTKNLIPISTFLRRNPHLMADPDRHR